MFLVGSQTREIALTISGSSCLTAHFVGCESYVFYLDAINLQIAQKNEPTDGYYVDRIMSEIFTENGLFDKQSKKFH